MKTEEPALEYLRRPALFRRMAHAGLLWVGLPVLARGDVPISGMNSTSAVAGFLGLLSAGLAAAWWRDARRHASALAAAKAREDRLVPLAMAFDQTSTSFLITDLNGTIRRVNSAFEKISGYRAQEVIGQSPRLLKSCRHPPELYQSLWNTLKQGETWRGELCNRRKDGSTYWVRSTISPIFEHGVAISYMALQEECEGQDPPPKEHRETNQHLSKLAAQLPGMLFQLCMDPENHLSFPFASEGVRAIFEISPEDILKDARPIFSRIHPGFLPIVHETLRASRDALGPWQCTFAVNTSSGDLHWIEVNATPDQLEDGSVLWHGFATDVTERRRIEEEYERLSLVAQKTSSGVIMINRDGLIEWCNPAFEELSGYSQKELLGKSPTDLLTGADGKEEHLDLLRDCLRVGVGFSRDLVSYSKAGQPYWAHLDITPVRGSSSEVEQFIGIQTDITERKQAEDEMNLLAERLSIATDSSGIGVWDLDINTHELVWDDRMHVLYGCEYAEFQGTLEDWLNRIHPQDLAKTQTLLQQAIEHNRPFEADFRIRQPGPNGLQHHVKAFARLVADREAKKRRLIGTTWDITALKQAEMELKKSESRFRTLYELSPIGIALITMEGRFAQANRTMENMLGYATGELEGRTVWEISTPDSRQEDVAQFDLLLRDGRCGPYEKEFIHQKGHPVSVLVGGAVVHNQDGSRRVWLVIQDISQRKEMERGLVEAREASEDANRAKSAFLATMSHEIRTPMNGVIGMTSLLLDSPLNDDQREFVNTIRTSGDTLLALINDILDFSKIESGRLDLEQVPFEISGAIEDALDLLAPAAFRKQLELAYVVEDSVPHALLGDITRVRQILVNLVGNAVKFTAQGEILVTVAAQLIEGNNHQVHVSVRDTGIGIPADRVSHLFQPFSQVDSSTTRKYGGTGLGLAISRRLTQIMGGEMWVESQINVGSTFHFTFTATAHNRPHPAPAADQPTLATLSGKKVLIVDDNATNRRILERHADLWGMRATLTDSGHAALSLLRGGTQFDLIILDMHMPDMDGEETARTIQRLGLSPPVPVLLFTSLGTSPKMKTEGIAAVLSKPIKPAAMRDALLRLLSEPSAPAAAPKPAPPPAAQKETSSLRILLAEDNPINQRVAQLVLRRLGYSCDTAANGLEVLAALERIPYDVVLMDCLMPEMDGYAATAELRKKRTCRADGNPVYIIALTANAMEGDREKAVAAGMDDYLTKPLRPEALAKAIEKGGAPAPAPA